jgi:hypothetical protein
LKSKVFCAPDAFRCKSRKENRATFCILLYGVPTTRGGGSGDNIGQSIEIIEDLVPLFDINCCVRTSENVKSACLVLGGEELQIGHEGNAVTFTVPKLLYHQMVELGY